MSKNKNNGNSRNSKWGSYLIMGIIVAALCVGVLLYIGWFDNNTHVDSKDGDNVTQNYTIDTPQPDAPGVNDWENPDQSSLQTVIVDHAEGTDTKPLPE